jgi:threonylcarbamoyladenosine tRNA methylthiotransferase MtaB
MPDAAIGADVMVGFPGETDELFEESRAFIEAMPFTYLHVFTYSERPGTQAATMAGAVPMPVRKQRNKVLRDLAESKGKEFRESMVGREFTAVTLDPPGLALTDNFVKASLDMPYAANRMVKLRVAAVSQQGVTARIVSAA